MEGQPFRHSTTAAPAPSPKRMQVPRSSQLVTRLRVSAPTTRPYFRGEAFSRHSMVWRAKRNPVQAALRSKQGMSPGRPSSRWRTQAAEGTRVSAVTVATTQAPISSGETPARSSAARAAPAHREPWVSDTQWRRRRMPVRLVIHWSVVSTIFAMSSLVTTRWGTQRPMPLILIPFMGPPSGCPRPSV